MCGLAGVATWAEAAESGVVRSMLHAMAHRGPDGRGVFDGDGVCLGSVRLAIVDSGGSDQPISVPQADVHLVFNGEIYNYRRLREKLGRRGHSFRTEGDGEVVLRAYLDDPENFASILDGMFAFALWDGRRRRLVLGRDRCGIKPLHYWTDGRRVVFASELKALLTDQDVPLAVNRDAIADYLSVRFPVPPGCSFAGVRKVRPGTAVYFDGSAASERVRPFAVLDVLGAATAGSLADNTLAHELQSAVDTTREPDGRLGLLLSGGLDSTTIAALATRHTVEGVQAFSVGYETSTWEDETGYARKAADHLAIAHQVTVLDATDVEDCFADTVWHLEEPIYTPVCLSTYAVAGLAAQGHKSVLAGDGSDELLLGYAHMHAAHRLAENGQPWHEAYWDALGWLPAQERATLLDDDMADRCAPAVARTRAGFTDAVASGVPAADVIRDFEVTKKLPEYHLTRVDRLSMAHSLEVRVPFLRNDVVAWALSRSAGDLMRGEPKQPLRDVARLLVPDAIVDRPKQKFSAPARTWLSGPLRSLALELLHQGAGAPELGLDPAGLRWLASSVRSDPLAMPDVAWGVIVLLAWYHLTFDRLRRVRAEGQLNR